MTMEEAIMETEEETNLRLAIQDGHTDPKPCDFCGADCRLSLRRIWCDWTGGYPERAHRQGKGSYHHKCEMQYSDDCKTANDHKKYCHTDDCEEFPYPPKPGTPEIYVYWRDNARAN